MSRFMVGSKWRCINLYAGSLDKIYTLTSPEDCNGFFNLTAEDGAEIIAAKGSFINMYFNRIPDDASPIRAITRKEIVPGKYGCVVVGNVSPAMGVSICLQNQGLSVELVYMTADELEAAASVMTQIAGVLRENGK